VSEAALLQGRFWPVHDALFEAPRRSLARAPVLERLAELGLDLARLERDLASGQPRASVREDVALCGELGLTATPLVVLGGHVLRGGMPPWMVDELLSVLLDGDD